MEKGQSKIYRRDKKIGQEAQKGPNGESEIVQNYAPVNAQLIDHTMPFISSHEQLVMERRTQKY